MKRTHPDFGLPPRLPSDAELVVPQGAEPESAIVGPVAGRYDLGVRIARGGMGVVYRAHDRLLNRTVAVKVMRGKYMDRPDLIRRFLAEARINGRLQHPGVVPVYEVGTLHDTRPFIAMKLIEGETLAKILRERHDPADNQAHFLKVFEALCQTMAYAHQQGVIHRDLKPDNVMVGAFGEVQVMDWGLAKFLDPAAAVAPSPDGFEAIEKSAFLSNFTKDGNTPVGDFPTQATSVIAVGPDTPGFPYTTAGEVFGTLAYMPPEQARGAMDRVDRRGDVFSLGAILCQILTGQPPYFGPTDKMRELAREGKLFGAYLLLDRSGADQTLIQLAKQCLSADPAARPADAVALARMVTECLDGLQDRTKQIEVTRLKMEARLSESEARERLARKARRLARMLAVAAVMVAALLVAGLGWYSNNRSALSAAEEQRRASAGQQITEALDEAEILNDQARASASAPLARQSAAKQAISACQRAEVLLATMPRVPEELQSRFNAVNAGVADTERGVQLAVDIEQWRAESFDTLRSFDPAAAAQRCRTALTSRYFDVLNRTPAAVAAEIKSHPAGAALLELLVDWLAVTPAVKERQHLAAVLKEADRSQAGSWLAALDADSLEATASLADVPGDAAIPATGYAVAGWRLAQAGQSDAAERLLIRGVRRFPNDAKLNGQLGLLLSRRPEARGDAIRYLTAARAARPNDANVSLALGQALADAGRNDEAIDTLRAAARSNPKLAAAHARIADLLEAQGDVDGARSSYITATTLEPTDGQAHLGVARGELARGNLEAAEHAFRVASKNGSKAAASAGLARIHMKRWEAAKAAAAFRVAIEAEPKNLDYRLGLVEALRIANDNSAAIVEARIATKFAPRSATVHRLLGELLRTTDDKTGAISAYRTAANIDPSNVDTHLRLASLCDSVDDLFGAASAYRAAANLRPDDPKLQANAARALTRAGEHADAVALYRRLLSAEPGNAMLRQQLGRLLAEQHEVVAVDELQRAAKADPKSGDIRADLGMAQLQFGRFRAAATTLREAAGLLPADQPRHDAAKTAARNATRWAGLATRLPEILAGVSKPSTAAAWADFGEVCQRTERYAAAARFFATAAQSDEQFKRSAVVCAALAGFGRGSDAAELTEKQRGELRHTALESLRVTKSWAGDPVLTPLKSPAALNLLTKSEREMWQALWVSIEKR